MVSKQQVLHWVKQGLLFGYPNCCVDSFIQLKHLRDNSPRKLNGTGFIPCAKCNITKTEEELIYEINNNRYLGYAPFKALDPKPGMLYIVMGKTEARVFEHTGIPLHRKAAEYWATKLNYAYIRNKVAIRFYITPILDI